jgi:hypothetical protein
MVPKLDDVVGQARNAFPFTVSSNSTQCVWIDIHIPANATSGVYNGTAVVNLSGQADVNVSISLTIWGFGIPSTSSLRSFFALTYPVLPAQHSGISGNQAAWNQLRQRYSILALDHRMAVSGVDTGDSSIGSYTTYHGPLVTGTANTQLQGAEYSSVYPMPYHRAAVVNYLKSVGRFSKAFDYTCDEPPQFCSWSQIPSRANTIHGIDANFKTLVTTTIREALDNGVQNSIDILVPVINFIHDKSGTFAGNQRGSYDSWLAGKSIREVWLYQSCMSHGCGGSSSYFTGWASYMVDASPLRARMMGWLCHLYRATGELYFETGFAYTTGDPWADIYEYTGNGDGTLFYPGTTGRIGGSTDIPLASMRMKMIRAGYQDYEYLKILEGLGDPLGRTLAQQMFPNPYTSPNPDVFWANRIQIGQRIHDIGGGGPIGGNPAPTIESIEPTLGAEAGGTEVTIHGTNFLSGATVIFGSNAATILDVTSGQIICVTPPGLGVSNVTVTNPDFKSTTLSEGYTYIFVPLVPVGPPMEPSWPVSVQHTASTQSLVLQTPPAAANRLVYVVLIWNTRNNTNATPWTINGLGLAWTKIREAVFTSQTPGHEGVQIWAAWASSALSQGTIIAQPAAGNTTDVLLTAYARFGTVSGAASVTSCFGVSAGANGPTGSGSVLQLGMPGMLQQSGAVIGMVDGQGSFGVSPRANTQLDFQNNAFVSMAVGQLVQAPSGGTTTVGCTEPAFYWAIAAAEILTAGTGGVTGPAQPTGLSPASGSTAGGNAVLISGTNFHPEVIVLFDTTAATLVSVDTTSIAAFTPPHAAGAVNVTLRNPGAVDGVLPSGFTYVAPPPPPVTVANPLACSPATGSTDGGNTVVITGTDFLTGATVLFGGISATVTAVAAGSITVVTPAHAAGAVDVAVTNPGASAGTLVSGFTYEAPPPPPPPPSGVAVPTAVTPSTGTTAGGTAAVISGTNFVAGAEVRFDSTGAAIVSLEATAIAVFTPPHAAAVVNVSVINPGEVPGTLAGGFTYEEPAPPPSPGPAIPVSLLPITGATTGGNTVVIFGSNFAAGLTVTFGGSAAIVNARDTIAIAVVTPPHAAGTVDIVVTNPGEVEAVLGAAYTYETPPSTGESAAVPVQVSPAIGSVLGGNSVSVFGSNFATGVKVYFDGLLATVVQNDGTTISVVTPAHGAGTVNVTVTNPNATPTTLISAFTYSSTGGAPGGGGGAPGGGGGGRPSPGGDGGGPPGDRAALVSGHDLTRIQHPSDRVVNAIQDQLLKNLNPIIQAISKMPVAVGGVFSAQAWQDGVLINGWKTEAGSQVGFYIDSAGVVHLRGSATNPNIGKPMMVLPVGARSSRRITRPVTSVGASYASIVIDPDGFVTPTVASATPGGIYYITIDEVTFRAEG